MKKILKWILIVFAAFIVLSCILSGGKSGGSASRSVTDAVVNPQMNAITDKVARDAVDKYNMAKETGSAIDICVQAGLVEAAWLQAKNQTEYKNWHAIKQSDCKKAGMPM